MNTPRTNRPGRRGLLRSLLRFRLRTLLLLTTVCCVLLAVWARTVKPYRDQAASAAVVADLQGRIERELPPLGDFGWKRELVEWAVGDDAYVHVTEVDLTQSQLTDAELAQLAGLRHLRKLTLDRTQITDAGLATVARLAKLEELTLRYCPITDAGVAEIAKLSRLRHLNLMGVQLSDAAVDELCKLTKLERLFVRWAGLSQQAAGRLQRELPNCAVHHHYLPAGAEPLLSRVAGEDD